LSSALGAKGNFGVRGNMIFRLKERTMTMAPFETVMTFDGSNVLLEQARLSSHEIEAFLSGDIKRVLDSPTLALALKGSVNLDKAIKWVPPPPVPVTGQATIEGKIAGPARNFAVDLNVHSNTLDVGRERDLTLAGPVRVTFDAFSGHDLIITPQSGGSVRAKFNVPWGRTSISTAEADWKGVDSTAALRMADVDPQAIGATFEGHGTFAFSDPRRFVISNRSYGHPGRGVVPMTGTINATIVGDDYEYDHRNSFPGFDFEGKMSGRIKRGAATLSTMNGPAHARVSDVAQAAQSVATLGFPVAEIMLTVHGAFDAPMTLGGSYRYPEVETKVAGDAVDLPLLGVARASASVVANTKTASISAIDIRRGTSTITGDVVADITNRRWSGKLHAEAPNAAELEADVPEQWRVAGHLSADADLGGTFDEFTLDTTIAGSDLEFAGQAIDRATAKAIVTAEAIDFSSLELHQGAGYLSGRLKYAWETGAYDADLKGDRLTWRGTLLSPNDTQALFAMQFSGAGTTAHPKGKASVDFVLTGGTAGDFIGNGDATADLQGDQARIVARLPTIGAMINADIATASPYDYRASATLDRFELARLGDRDLRVSQHDASIELRLRHRAGDVRVDVGAAIEGNRAREGRQDSQVDETLHRQVERWIFFGEPDAAAEQDRILRDIERHVGHRQDAVGEFKSRRPLLFDRNSRERELRRVHHDRAIDRGQRELRDLSSALRGETADYAAGRDATGDALDRQ
jgi:hypothetical protein